MLVRRFAEICKVLGLKVLILSKSFTTLKDQYPEYSSCDLNEVLQQADIISFHCKPNADGSSVIASKELTFNEENTHLLLILQEVILFLK